LDGACQKERALARKTKHRLIEMLSNRLTLSNIMTSDGDVPFIAQVTTISGHDPVHMLTLKISPGHIGVVMRLAGVKTKIPVW
jgi:hypothetical protein